MKYGKTLYSHLMARQTSSSEVNNFETKWILRLKERKVPKERENSRFGFYGDLHCLHSVSTF